MLRRMPGAYRVDLHCHSSASYDGKLDPVRLVEIARERGLTHVAITDHETIDGALAAQAAEVDGITVIVGEEVRTTDGDLILLFVQDPIPRGLSVAETVERGRAQGCVIGLPHPFDVYRPSIAAGIENHDGLRALAAMADYAEVHNGRVQDALFNAHAADLCRLTGLAQAAASDCHTRREIGTCYVELTTKPTDAAHLTLGLATAALRVTESPDDLPRDSVGLTQRLKGLFRRQEEG